MASFIPFDYNNNNSHHRRRNQNDNDDQQEQRTGMTEWFDHWSAMFPFATPEENQQPQQQQQRPPPSNGRILNLSVPGERSSGFILPAEDYEQVSLEHTATAFQKHLSRPSLDHTVRTTSSSFQEDEGDNNAWNTFRSWGRVGSFSGSFTDGTLEDATAAEELQDDEDDDFFASTSFAPPATAGSSKKMRATNSKHPHHHRRRRRHHHSSSSHHHRTKWYNRHCDKTTKRLAILVAVLFFIVVLLSALTRPFQNRSEQRNINSNNSQNGTDQQPEEDSMAPNATPTLRPKPADRPPSTNYFPQLPSLEPTVVPQPTSETMTSPPTVSTIQSPAAAPVAAPAPVATPSTPPQEDTSSSQPPTRPNVSGAPVVPVQPLIMGPLVGHTTHNSANLWAFHSANAQDNMELVVYDAFDQVIAVEMIPPDPRFNNVYQTTLQNLRPKTLYKYGMHVQGTRIGQGTFTTFSEPDAPTQFDYILVSCMNARQYRNQIVWNTMIANNGGKVPDFSIMAGDTIYLQEGVDVTNEDGVLLDRYWFRTQEQREDPYFANFIRNVPTYASWNDHDYGRNNADKNQKGKHLSLQAFQSLWANPGYGDANSDDGIYYSFYHGNVHFLVTDDHWYRDSSTRNRLGVEQTAWLERELQQSTGVFKVIVIGGDIMERGWESDLNNIGRIVTNNRIEGVLFNAGDIHRNEYKSMTFGGTWPYPVKQITSSGVARVWRRPYAHIKVNTALEDPTLTAHFFGAANSNPDTVWTNDPNLVCSSIVGIQRDQEHTCTQIIPLSALKIR
ncbi:phosphodiesterase I [Nitzschia inconspicua]|uniref:Phosphodiesterase I n=1 Tax=Nitzschia inconspicua TaxID=303405 RepID=A0A9K3KKE1_9STRA|nr:phosphodiesterase I [Nitzschia inconspicua]